MPATPPPQLSLSITNPLILYRTLVATRKIKPDPAQHRLALQLQKLYFRLKDYAPEIEYRYRLEKIGRSVQQEGSRRGSTPASSPSSPSSSTTQTKGRRRDGAQQQRGGSLSEKDDDPDDDPDGDGDGGYGQSRPAKGGRRGRRGGGIFSSLLSLRTSLPSTTLALTRTTPLHDSALAIGSPMGMLLYGEVGRGKSMLLDLLYETLPSRQKRRWHFNTFMLDVFRRIERVRIERLGASPVSSSSARSSLFGRGGRGGVSDHEHVMLRLAKDTVCDSPILFLDEFQMPDRAASKLVNGFFTAFFHLGGVLVASSNRMPEELSKAAGIEFGGGGLHSTASGRAGAVGGFFGLGWGTSRESEGERAAKTDFGLFLEVLRARCEIWEMEGEKDWRREGDDDDLTVPGAALDEIESLDGLASIASNRTDISSITSLTESTTLSSDTPAHYHINLPSPSSNNDASFERDLHLLNPSSTWTSTTLTIYGRRLELPSTHGRVLKSTFAALCATYLGPADYVSLCSTFHTLVLTDVPVLTLAQKNEARRFITLLDALYEARCRLLIRAAAPPDKLFFPETRIRRAGTATTATAAASHGGDGGDDGLLDSSEASITSESFSEMYQDSTAPFRPNISSYTEANTHSSTPFSPPPSFTPSLYNPSLRNVLADEDADFGPTYGNGRGHGVSDSAPSRWATAAAAPDFTSTAALTGEDERFAYKRARSRLWEMCGRRWWDERLPRVGRRADRHGHGEKDTAPKEESGEDEHAVSAWWRPVHRSGRFWEPAATGPSDEGKGRAQPVGGTATENLERDHSTPSPGTGPGPGLEPASRATTPPTSPQIRGAADTDTDTQVDTHTNTNADPKPDALFRHDGASPYRTHADPPPTFGWQHAWGMMRWGKRAGEWGKGVEGTRGRGRRYGDGREGGEKEGRGEDDDDAAAARGSREK